VVHMRRILAIDGGGIKGVFPASFLSTVEDALHDRVAKYFDLIAGTSTGGIIALGLGLGLSARQVLEFYETAGPEIFGGNRLLKFLRHVGFSKYNQGPLKNALTSAFGDRRMRDSNSRLVIPSLNLETGEVYVYKTPHHPRLERDGGVRVVDVALATSAAPTFFPTHRSAAGTPLIDGGMWANNPTGMAVVEAIGILEWPRDSLQVLSIGCTTTTVGVGWGRRYPLGFGYWGLKVVDVFMTAQSSASLGTAQLLASHDRVVRVSPNVGKGRFALDSIGEMASLKGLGDSEARKSLPTLRKAFLNTPAEPVSFAQ
jgi:uncharacterized protein